MKTKRKAAHAPGRLKLINSELLEACKGAYEYLKGNFDARNVSKELRQAILKAEGKE